MLKSMTLARLELDGRHIAGLRYALDDARLALRLDRSGMPSRLYDGQAEGAVKAIVIQLSKLSTAGLMLWVSRETLHPTLQLVRRLHAARPRLAIHLWCAQEDAAQFAPSIGAEATLTGSADVDALALQLTQRAPSATEAIESPYRAGTLPREAIARLGLSAADGLAALADDLRHLEPQAAAAAPIRLDATALDGAGIGELAGMLASPGLAARFELHLDAASCAALQWQALAIAQVALVVLHGDPGAINPASLAGLKIAMTSAAGTAAAKAAAYGKNGTAVLHSGAYYDGKQFPGIYHLELPVALDQATRAAAYAWAGEHLSLRSAAVLTGSQQALSGHAAHLQSPVPAETQGWPKHTYAIGAGADQDAQLVLDGNGAKAVALQYVPLSRLRDTAPAGGTLTFGTIRSATDLAELERLQGEFHDRGALTPHRPENAIFLENACRWAGNGRCSQSLLRRVSVLPDQSVLSCRDAGRIGSLVDSYGDMLDRVNRVRQQTEVDRKCATCAVRDECSRCSALPDLLGDAYCGMRKKFPQMALYIELLQFQQLVPQLLPQGGERATMTVSYSGLPQQHYRGAPGAARHGLRPVVLTVGGQHIAWWRGTPRMTRLSAPLALIAEAWWTGASDADTIQALMASFDVAADVATSSLHDGRTRLLQNAVILH